MTEEENASIRIIEALIATVKSQQERIDSFDIIVRELIEAHKVHALVHVLSVFPLNTPAAVGRGSPLSKIHDLQELRSKLRVVDNDET